MTALPTSGLIGHWQSSDLSLANGATVNPWPSDGSYGPDLDETGGTAPTFDTTVAKNGHAGVRFTASRTIRDTSVTGYTSGVAGGTLYVVAKLDDATGAPSRRALAIATGASVTSSRFVLYAVAGVPSFAARRLDGVAAAVVSGVSSIGTTSPHILTGTIDYATTTQALYLDGTLLASSSSALSSGVTSTASLGVGVGSHPGNTSEGWPGVVYKALVYDHAHDSTERANTLAYLREWMGYAFPVTAAAETHTLGTLGWSKSVPVTAATETATPHGLVFTKRVGFTAAAQTNTARSMGWRGVWNVQAATSTQTARSLTFVKDQSFAVTAATETETPYSLTFINESKLRLDSAAEIITIGAFALGRRLWIFRPPTVTRRYPSTDWFTRKLHYEKGLTIVRTGIEYVPTEFPSQEEVDAADDVWMGGYVYDLTPAQKAGLVGAGYEEYITSEVRLDDGSVVETSEG